MSGALPVEIAFLQRHGLSRRELENAAAHAARIGSEPVRELIALGSIDESGYYRALAAEHELAFQSEPPALKGGGRYGAILRAGWGRTAEGETARFVLAPEGPALRHLLTTGARLPDDIAITTPRAFADGLRRANAESLAQQIAGLDATGIERASARTGTTRGQRIALGIAAGLAGGGGVLAPLESFFALALLMGPLFLCVIALRLAASFEDAEDALAKQRRWRLDDSRLPVYTVAIPLFREEAVLCQIIRSMTALDYPPAKLDIQLLVEEEDEGLRHALSRIVLPSHINVVVVPDGQPRTKPRALNLALLEARGTLFTIFDAEDIPDPQQLRLAAARFQRAPDALACLQARLVIDNLGDGLLPNLFALEYAGLFCVLNPGLLRGDLPIMLGGTSNHFRTDALRAVGGWDAWNVTEDADLGFRLARAGYRMADLPSHTYEEAPIGVRAWLRQRSRWMKGYLQTLATHSRSPLALLREAGLLATLAFMAQLLGTVVAALGYPVFVVATWYAWQDGSLLAPSGMFHSATAAMAVSIWIFGFFAMLAPVAIGAMRRRSPSLLMLLPALPIYYALISAAAWLALYEYLSRPFTWNKTMHGLGQRHAPREPVRSAPPVTAISES